MTTHFASDYHFGHTNIIEYCNRPFDNAYEMDEVLIENWNTQVAADDEVWFLGDWFLGHTVEEAQDILRRLNGHIHTVLGNHDERTIARRSERYLGDGMLESVHSGFVERKIHGQRIVMSHYAMATWNMQAHGTWMLHGHSHGTLLKDPNLRRLDVGVDGVAGYLNKWRFGYRPISFEEVQAIMDPINPRPVDHHGRRV